MSKAMENIKGLNVKETEVKIIELKAELSKSKSLNVSGTKQEKPSKIKELRKKIARMFTHINEAKNKTKESSKNKEERN